MSTSAVLGRPIAVILAAGEGRRMGHPKALLEYPGGGTFLRHLAVVFERAGCEVVAVLGMDSARIRQAHTGIATLDNERWSEGQLSSARLGIASALARGAAIILIHPVDAPTIRTETIQDLLSNSRPDRATVPEYRGTAGHPLVLPHKVAERILELEAMPHLEAGLASVGFDRVGSDDPGVALNLNTPEEYERAFGRPPSTASAKGSKRKAK